MPSRDVAADVGFFTEVLGGRLVFAIDGMGTRVAMIELTDGPPQLLLAGHLEGDRPVLVYRVADLDAAATDLESRGWTSRSRPGDPAGARPLVRGARRAPPGDLPADPARRRRDVRRSPRLLRATVTATDDRRPATGLTNWAGNHAYVARDLHEPGSLDELQELVRRSGSLRVLGLAALVQRHRRHDRRPRLARAPAARLRAGPGRVDRDRRRRRPLRRAVRTAARGRVRAAQPRLAAAHLGRRGVRDGDPRIGRPERQSRDGGHGRRAASRPMGRRSRSPGRRTRRRSRGPSSGSERSGSSPGSRSASSRRSRCARTCTRTCRSRRCRPLRRDHRAGGQRQPVHRVARTGLRGGLAEAPGRSRRRRSSRRQRSTAPPGPPSRSTRSAGCRRMRARSSSGCPGRGTSDCRTSGWTTRRAPVPSCRPSTCCRAATRSTRWSPSTACATGSHRSSWCPRSARSPPTTSG